VVSAGIVAKTRGLIMGDDRPLPAYEAKGHLAAAYADRRNTVMRIDRDQGQIGGTP